MSETRASIAALALMKIGATDVYATPNGNPASRSIDRAWDAVRRAVLRGNGKHQPKWNFALRYVEATARVVTEETPLPFGWTAGFAMPADFVRLAELVDCDGADRWMFAGGELLTRGAGPARFWYVADADDVATWDASFVQTFAARLAFEIADAIAGDTGRRKDCWAEFEAGLAAAAKVDAVENPPVESIEDDWIEARYR